MSLIKQRTIMEVEACRFSIRLRNILNRMDEIALNELKTATLNAEPLMLALLEENDCDVVQALYSLGVTTESFRKALVAVRKTETRNKP